MLKWYILGIVAVFVSTLRWENDRGWGVIISYVALTIVGYCAIMVLWRLKRGWNNRHGGRTRAKRLPCDHHEEHGL